MEGERQGRHPRPPAADPPAGPAVRGSLDEFHLALRLGNGVTRVVCRGPLDRWTAPILDAALAVAVGSGPARVVLDVGGTTRVDGIAVLTVAGAARAARALDIALVVEGAVGPAAVLSPEAMARAGDRPPPPPPPTSPSAEDTGEAGDRPADVGGSADDDDDPAGRRMTVLGGFLAGADDRDPTLAPGPARLLAYLALQRGASSRLATAGTLWPDVTEERALASLRSTLSRLGPEVRRDLLVSNADIGLEADVTVDLHEARALAERLLDREGDVAHRDTTPSSVSLLSTELLPGWYDDWVIVQAEEWRQLRVHALEALAVRLEEEGRFGEAVSAALAAVAAEPVRESSWRVLIGVHLAEGNASEALAAADAYRRLLHDELGLAPTAELEALVAHLAPPDAGVDRR